MTGRFIAFVGSSSVGKDSVRQQLAVQNPRFVLARRVITRSTDAGGEAFDSVTEAEFQNRKSRGQFALSWPAHGLQYAIPQSVDEQIKSGHDVLANLSRAVLVHAKQRFTQFVVLNLTADRATLAAGLSARARETPDQIVQRLDRVPPPLPSKIDIIEIDNSGSLERTVQMIIKHLYPVSM